MQETLDFLVNAKPDVIAVSVYIWNSAQVREILSSIKTFLPRTQLVLGGPEVSYNPQCWLTDYPDIDYIICGEGETAFRKLTESSFQLEEQIVRATPQSSWKFPYTLSELETLKNRYLYYEASRGCNYRCTFCLSSREDSPVRYRNVDRVIAELQLFCDTEVRIVKFVDRTFNSNAVFARKIWSFLSKLAPSTRFHFEIRADLLKEKDFQLLAEIPAGLFQFEIGIQSCCPHVLQAVNRPASWQTTRTSILRLLALGNIHIHIDLLTGLPEQTSKDIAFSFNEVYPLKAHHLQLGSLKLLPGTRLHDEQQKLGLKSLDLPPFTVLQTPELSYSFLQLLRRMEKLINLLYNKHNFPHTLEIMDNNFDSPFEFYTSLTKFWITDEATFHTINQRKASAKLLNFASHSEYLDAGLIRDYLRWDWLVTNPGQPLPPELSDSDWDKMQKTTRKHLYNSSNQDFALQDIRR